MLFTGMVIDLVLAACVLFIGLVHANLPTGKSPGPEIVLVLGVLVGAPLAGWSLYKKGRVDIRRLLLLVWVPIVLPVIWIPSSIAQS